MRGYIIKKTKRVKEVASNVGSTCLTVGGWASVVVVLYANVYRYHMRQHKVGSKGNIGK